MDGVFLVEPVGEAGCYIVEGGCSVVVFTIIGKNTQQPVGVSSPHSGNEVGLGGYRTLNVTSGTQKAKTQ